MRTNETCDEIHGESRWMGRAMRSGGGAQRAVEGCVAVAVTSTLPGPGSRSRGEGDCKLGRERRRSHVCVLAGAEARE